MKFMIVKGIPQVSEGIIGLAFKCDSFDSWKRLFLYLAHEVL